MFEETMNNAVAEFASAMRINGTSKLSFKEKAEQGLLVDSSVIELSGGTYIMGGGRLISVSSDR